MNLENLIKQGSKSLKEKNINSYTLDAELLLSNVMGTTKEFLLLNGNLNISQKKIEKYKKLIKRRVQNEPIAYIVGKKEFWSQNFIVNSSTLVPRPETELMLYKLIKHFKDKQINILDIGTGSGCILLSLLKELKNSIGTGIDISNLAIQIAIQNSKALNLLNRSKFKVCDLHRFNFGKYDLIVSNPPYIPTKDIKSLSKDITNFEPLIALNGGKDGLDLIKKVIYKSSVLLKKNGLFSLEIGTNQYTKVKNIMVRYKFRIISKEYDYNKNVRCIISTKCN
jgi:release factor glutamine methyltransferase